MNRYVITEYGVSADCGELQTAKIQAVLDLCKESGGTVVIPKGRFHTAALRMWSNTTLYLEHGAELYGSADCDDYEVFEIPDGVEMRSDMELITQYYGEPWETYRRAIISAYGEKNISIIGEADAVIDGANCYDPNGEEGYRGPHAIFFTCCENVLLEGYTARHSGNFLHEANNCKNVTMRRVTCLGGSDGIHLHCSENTLIEDCLFKTGDDCIAGINIKNLLVRRCVLNTSCDLFRIGGVQIHVEDCYAYGPGYYPHRMTVVKGKNDELPREEGRHDLLHTVVYFASQNYPYAPSDIHFKNCVIENAKNILNYAADRDVLQKGTYLGEFTLENVRFTDLKETSAPVARADVPLTVRMKDVSVEFHESATDANAFTIAKDANTTLIVE
ncbi:MAG: hypothetical protein IJW50_02390 [Clostridia bacterium]|nr:hypothetical protein [Clostridia bacterium]MBQ9807198.1 hypothetical protein [Clostridia bacterium]